MWPFNLPLFDALCWWIMDEPGKESWGIHRGATDIESLPSSSPWKLLVKVSEDASGARYETSGRVWNSVFVFQTVPKTLKIPQADPSRSVRLKPELHRWSLTNMECDLLVAMVVAHSSHWHHESSTPAWALVLSLLELGARIKISLCSWLLGSGEKVEERKGCRGHTPTRNTTEEERRDSCLGKSI